MLNILGCTRPETHRESGREVGSGGGSESTGVVLKEKSLRGSAKRGVPETYSIRERILREEGLKDYRPRKDGKYGFTVETFRKTTAVGFLRGWVRERKWRDEIKD